MSPKEFADILGRLRDPRFAEAVSFLLEASRGGESQISASSRSIPATELIEIYVRRREHCNEIGLHIAGLDPLVDVLTAESNASWTILSFRGIGRWGLVFLRGGTDPYACLAGSDDKSGGMTSH